MPRSTHATIAVAILCTLAVAAPGRAQDANGATALTITGHWMGFGESVTPAAPSPIPIPYPVVADISPLDQHRRFSVTLLLPAVQQGLTISGTVAASGNVNIEGGDGGIQFSAHGRFVEKNPGPPGIPAVQIAALKYHVERQPGPGGDEGFILLVQAQGGPNWRNPGPAGDVSGEWAGEYVSDRPGGGCFNAGGGLVMDLVQQRAGGVADQGGALTSAFAGTLTMDNVLIPAVQRALTITFDVTGTIATSADPNDGAPFVLIGLEPPPDPDFQSGGIIAVLVGLKQPGPPGAPDAITGNYALLGSFADVFSEIWRGTMSSFDSGGFTVERQPGPNGR